MVRLACLVLSALAVCGPALAATTNATVTDRARQASTVDLTRIEIAAFGHLLAHDDSTGADRKYALILCVGSAAPPKDVLAAIGKLHANVLPCGVATATDRVTHELRIEGDPQRPAIRYSLGEIAIHGDDASLEAGYYEASESAASYTITLHRSAGEWRVTGSTMNWIS